MDETNESWIDELAHARAHKDAFFSSSHDSPIPHERRRDFGGLPYFPADPRFHFEDVQPRPVPDDVPRSVTMQTSDGRERDAERAGILDVTVDGRPVSLTAYRFSGDDPHQLFAPFRDATSGVETYGAGRYLDLEADEDGRVDLDFNLAYNPFCAYSEAYSCPLPPPENRLPVRIEAGERYEAPAASASGT
jgi:uncharacterized protein (DUF1684 family)